MHRFFFLAVLWKVVENDDGDSSKTVSVLFSRMLKC